MSLSYQYSSLSPSVRTFDPAGEPLLSLDQDILRLLKEAGIFNLLTLAGSEEGFTTDIYAYYPASFRQGAVGDILTGEADIPFACRVSAYGNSFNVAFNRAGEAKLKLAYIPDRKVFAIQFPTGLLQGEGVISISTFESGETRFISILHSAEEAIIGSIQPFKNILENLRAYLSVFWNGSSKLRELLNLVKLRDRAVIVPVNGNTLVKSDIVEISAKVEPVLGSLKGWGIRLNTILKGFFHLPCTMLS